MALVYACKCIGECDSAGLGLGRCIMRTDEPNSYCKWCAYAIAHREERDAYEHEFRRRG